MRLFHLARHPTRWIHLAILVLTLAFALNALADSAHSHQSSLDEAECGYCITFHGLHEASKAPRVAIAAPITDVRPSFIDVSAARSVTHLVAQPRAPPKQH